LETRVWHSKLLTQRWVRFGSVYDGSSGLARTMPSSIPGAKREGISIHGQRNIDDRKVSDRFILQNGGSRGMEEYGRGIVKASDDMHTTHRILLMIRGVCLCKAANWRDHLIAESVETRVAEANVMVFVHHEILQMTSSWRLAPRFPARAGRNVVRVQAPSRVRLRRL